MATTGTIFIDVDTQTGSNEYIQNDNLVNTVNLDSQQITFNPRGVESLVSIANLNLIVNQNQSFQTAVILAFPELNALSLQSVGNIQFSINRQTATADFYCTTDDGANEVDHWTYTFATGLCVIRKRQDAATVTYSAWLSYLRNIAAFTREIQV